MDLANGRSGGLRIGGSIKMIGSKQFEARMKMRVRRANDLRWLADETVRYFTDSRIPNMFRNGGIIRGPWGKGTKKWAVNTKWVAKAKGFNKPLFSTPSKSGIENSYRVSHRTRARSFELVVTNIHKAAAWLEKGIAGGFKRIHATNADYLKIPIAPGRFIYRKSVRKGSRKARHIVRTFPGDAKWAAHRGAEGIVHLNPSR